MSLIVKEKYCSLSDMERTGAVETIIAPEYIKDTASQRLEILNDYIH